MRLTGSLAIILTPSPIKRVVLSEFDEQVLIVFRRYKIRLEDE